MKTIKTQKIGQYVRKCIDVKNHGGSLTARYYDCAPTEVFMLPDDYVEQYREECKDGAYIVRSYGTPIAWTNDEGKTWTRPDVYYTVTTSRHQAWT